MQSISSQCLLFWDPWDPTLETRGCILINYRLLNEPCLRSRAESWSNHHSLLLEPRLNLRTRLKRGCSPLWGRRCSSWLGHFHLHCLKLGRSCIRRERLKLPLTEGPLWRDVCRSTSITCTVVLEGATQLFGKQIWKLPNLVADKLQHLYKNSKKNTNAMTYITYFKSYYTYQFSASLNWHTYRLIDMVLKNPKMQVYVLLHTN